MEDDDIPLVWFVLKHQMKSNSHVQIFPSFPIAKWFEYVMWKGFCPTSINWDPKGHVQDEKTPIPGFPKPTFSH
jgi:hypothetical protein